MGLLDDAIREHLELKRLHGAEPTEVARLEAEALGPARRQPAPEEGTPQPARESGPGDLTEPPADEPEAAGEPPPASIPEVHQPTAEFALEDLEDASQPPARDADHEHAAPEPAAPAPRDHEDEHDVVVADEEPDAEDVLEETPEFLQETPEHDRLWFEQRPPRDFDF